MMRNGDRIETGVMPPRPMRARSMLAVLAVLLMAFGMAWWARRPGRAAREVLHLDGFTMGTTYRVRVVLRDLRDAVGAERLAEAIDARLREINARMSIWDPDSEISRFNAHRSTEPFPVSEELASLVGRALDVAARSGGAFDPTVRPLVELWGFGPEGRDRPAPSASDIEAARARVGYALVEAGDGVLRKRMPEVEIDLGGIAKGYGVDAVAAVIASHGFTDMMVEIGGDLYAAGNNARGEPWRIGVDRPSTEARPGERLYGVLGIRDAGVATSGDYRNYRRNAEGAVYAHILDPREGAPVRGPMASVTVMAGDAALADALATALFVLGPAPGLAWLPEAYPEAEALFLVIEGETVREAATEGFADRARYRVFRSR